MCVNIPTVKDGNVFGMDVGTVVDGLVVGTKEELVIGVIEDGFKVVPIYKK